MTVTDVAVTTDPAPGHTAPSGRPSSFWLWWAVLTGGAVAGIVLVGLSYRQAIGSGPHQNVLFWAGVLAFMVPAVAYIATAGARRVGLLAVVTASGLFLSVPKILRNPFGPTYHDELAHWRQVGEIAASGHLFVPNTTIPIIASYPGLHIVTLTIRDLSGLSIWSSAMVLLALVHVVDLVAVFLLVEGFTRSSRAGALGAVVYSLNPSFMYFDTQFAYESLGITLFLLTLLAVQRVERAPTARPRWAWAAVAVVTGAGCAVTHHLSTACLCLVLVAWSAVAIGRRRRHPGASPAAGAVGAVTVSVLGVFAAWIVVAAPDTVSYLQPYVGQAVAQLRHAAAGGSGSRTLFGQGTNPPWERLAGFVAPLLALVVAALAVRSLRRRDPRVLPASRLRAGFATLFVFGLLYFPSIPFLLAPSGAEGARRTWAFTYLGVAVILAPTLARWLGTAPRARPPAAAVRWALLAAFVVALVGNVADGLDEAYRFPGPYALGSDTGSQTPQLAALARWFSDTVGPGNRVVADRFTGLELGTLGRQRLDAPSPGFPTYQIWLDRQGPSPALVGELSSSGYRYLVIDRRMTLPVSQLTQFFATPDAASSDGTRVVTAADLDRFASDGWMTRAYSSTDFVVYRFQFGSRRLPVDHS